jgi:hypothetical protein
MQARDAALNQAERGPCHRSRSHPCAPESPLRRQTRSCCRSAAAGLRGHERRRATARPSRAATLEGGGRGRARPRWTCRRDRTKSARRMRRGSGLRCSAARLERRSRPNAKRSFLRRTRRHEPRRRLERQTTPPPPQPRRRPPAQLGAPRHRAPARPPPQRNARLLPTAARRREDDAGGTPLRQARSCPPLLPLPMRATHTPLTTQKRRRA